MIHKNNMNQISHIVQMNRNIHKYSQKVTLGGSLGRTLGALGSFKVQNIITLR